MLIVSGELWGNSAAYEHVSILKLPSYPGLGSHFICFFILFYFSLGSYFKSVYFQNLESQVCSKLHLCLFLPM